MEILPIIYLAYMFISVYFLAFYFLLFLRGRKTIFEVPILKKHFSVSVVIPAYNEEDSIESSIKHIFDSDYDNIKEVIMVNDASTDSTKEILEKLKKVYPKLKVINNKVNTGNAAGAQNIGLKHATGELIAIIDADSYPAKDAIRKMVGFFEDPQVGAATIPILARNKKTFFEKLQAIEYSVIALTRKLLERVDAIYVTPGPLALYRKIALDEVGGFDEKNLTQDIEATWHLTAKGWKRRMCLDTNVTSTVPTKFKTWFKQRQRWSMGGLQTIGKYKSHFFRRDTMIGNFILPFFILSTFLGLLGLSIFVYLLASRFIRQYLLVKFSYVANTAVLTMEQFYFTPSVLNYLGIILFVMGAAFTILILKLMKERVFKRENIFKILIYLTFYLLLYPVIMITAIFKLLRKDMSW
jgi:cellulose synthase/poly-beta-1,6-N-acetylglucosamine synthase-like glycosyltransferase